MPSFVRIVFLVLLAIPAQTLAVYSLLDNGQIKDQDKHTVFAEPHFTISSPTGFNFIGHYEKGLDDDKKLHFKLGFGDVDFSAEGRLTWVPYPDTSDQPLIGFVGMVNYISFPVDSLITLRVGPLVSKKFETSSMGIFTPYASLPLGLGVGFDDLQIPITLNAGTQWAHFDWENLSIWTELGININDSLSHLSIAGSYTF